MKTKRYSTERISSILKEGDAGMQNGFFSKKKTNIKGASNILRSQR